mmetsp:Transcript_99780/g.321716  ORF Transcript_99780/g.321716 Transcript_99780/m.321716 type:complete len:325 (+) Transcript_99780:39-1013(+)
MATTAPSWGSAAQQPGAGQLRAWYDEAGELERQTEAQLELIHAFGPELRAARREAAAVRAAREGLARELPQAQRARRLAEASLAEVASELREAQEERARRERDNRGLHRSAAQLCGRLEAAEEAAARGAEAAAETEGLRDSACVEEASLQRALGGMGEVQQRLRQRVAEEREKRLRLEACAQAKFERAEEGREELRRRAQAHEAEAEAWQGRLAEQEERAQAALAALAGSRSEAGRVEVLREDHWEERWALQRELAQLREAHEELRRRLAAARERFTERARREADARKQWGLRHLERLDSRVAAQRRLDREVVVAEAPRAGLCA